MCARLLGCFLVMVIFLSSCAQFGQSGPLGTELFTPTTPAVNSIIVPLVATQEVKVNFGVLALNRQFNMALVGTSFSTVLTTSSLDEGRTIYRGKTAGYSNENVYLATINTVMVGHVIDGFYIYDITPTTKGTHLISKKDVRKLPKDKHLTPAHPLLNTSPLESPAVSEEAASSCGSVKPISDDGRLVDLLVVYTPAAIVGAGTEESLQAQIALVVAENNDVFKYSRISTRLRLVGMEKVPYKEDVSADVDIRRLLDQKNGLKEADRLRNCYGADIVVMITHPGVITDSTCGNAFRLTPGFKDNPGAFERFALITIRLLCLNVYSMAHEIGHVYGAHHNHEITNNDTAFFEDSFGYQGDTFVDIMAYQCPECELTMNYSNPDVLWKGKPMGKQGWSNVARTINITAGYVAKWRKSGGIPATVQFLTPSDNTLSVIGFKERTFEFRFLVRAYRKVTMQVRVDGALVPVEKVQGNEYKLVWKVPDVYTQAAVRLVFTFNGEEGASAEFTVSQLSVHVKGRILFHTVEGSVIFPGREVRSSGGFPSVLDGSGYYQLWTKPEDQLIGGNYPRYNGIPCENTWRWIRPVPGDDITLDITPDCRKKE